jgi:hypothetical protein
MFSDNSGVTIASEELSYFVLYDFAEKEEKRQYDYVFEG